MKNCTTLLALVCAVCMAAPAAPQPAPRDLPVLDMHLHAPADNRPHDRGRRNEQEGQ